MFDQTEHHHDDLPRKGGGDGGGRQLASERGTHERRRDGGGGPRGGRRAELLRRAPAPPHPRPGAHLRVRRPPARPRAPTPRPRRWPLVPRLVRRRVPIPRHRGQRPTTSPAIPFLTAAVALSVCVSVNPLVELMLPVGNRVLWMSNLSTPCSISRYCV